MAELTKEQAIADYTELMRRISVGAYEERSSEHYETNTWPEDGVEESVHNLDTWAVKQGLAFHWYKEESIYKLEPMSAEEIADYQLAQRLKEYKVALWPSALSVKPTFEMDVLAEDAAHAAILAMRANKTPAMGVVVVMSASEQEAFYDANIAEDDLLLYSRKATSSRQTDKPFTWEPESEG